MTILRIRVDKYLAGRNLRLGAVADIVPLAAETTKQKPVRGVVVPVGNESTTRDVEVAPGRYLLQATLPSGELLKRYVDVTAGTPSIDVVLESEDSPHEWLGVQHLLGSVPSRARVERQTRQEAEESLTLFASAAPPSTALYWFDASRADDSFFSWLSSADAIDDDALRYLVGNIIRSGQLEPQLTDNRFRKAEIPAVGALAESPLPQALDQLFRHGDGSVQPRRFVALMEDDKVRAIGAMPHEWVYVNYTRPGGGLPVPIEILIAPKSRVASKVQRAANRLSIAVGDPDVASMLSFLGHGNLQAASAMLELASEWLYGKFENPYAAAAGGYILISADGVADLPEQHWKDWLRNLAQHFSWLPDGKIQLAALILGSPEAEAIASAPHRPADVGNPFEKARDLSLQALAAGPPVFAFGVRMLLDNLTLLANADRQSGADDKRARMTQRARDVARWLSLRIDRAQPFTVIRL